MWSRWEAGESHRNILQHFVCSTLNHPIVKCLDGWHLAKFRKMRQTLSLSLASCLYLTVCLSVFSGSLLWHNYISPPISFLNVPLHWWTYTHILTILLSLWGRSSFPTPFPPTLRLGCAHTHRQTDILTLIINNLTCLGEWTRWWYCHHNDSMKLKLSPLVKETIGQTTSTTFRQTVWIHR